MKTILQVDDDANDVYLLQHAMKKVGVANPVQVVSDGQQAIDYLQGVGKYADRQTFPFPDLILMDLKLPYLMGLDVLRWIRAQPGMCVNVVILTASAEEQDIGAAYRLGANAFLTKPSEAAKLEDMVGAINAFWLTHNTLPAEPRPEFPWQRATGVIPTGEAPSSRENLLKPGGQNGSTYNGNGHPIPVFVERLIPRSKSQHPRASALIGHPLSRRQLQVVRLIADGCSNRQIAHQLSVSIKTVEKHRQALMDKLNIHEVATLTRYAVSNGLVGCTVAATAVPEQSSRCENPVDMLGLDPAGPGLP